MYGAEEKEVMLAAESKPSAKQLAKKRTGAKAVKPLRNMQSAPMGSRISEQALDTVLQARVGTT